MVQAIQYLAALLGLREGFKVSIAAARYYERLDNPPFDFIGGHLFLSGYRFTALAMRSLPGLKPGLGGARETQAGLKSRPPPASGLKPTPSASGTTPVDTPLGPVGSILQGVDAN